MTTTNELERASAPGRALAEAVEGGKVKMHDILQAMGINAGDPLFQAMLLVCDRYDLDPMLGHVEVLPRSKKPYITRDGFLHIAHASGQLDGIVLEREGESEDKKYYEATVSVYRKDMTQPFRFTGRWPKAKKHDYPQQMALKSAERTALKRAFNVAEPSEDDDKHASDTSSLVAEIDEMAAIAEWKEEHGDPAELEAGEVIDATSSDDTLDLDGGA
jgi:hypothetical protein